MGTNKQSEIIDLVRGTKLRIKYHADHALNPNQKDKLVRGLLLADQALEVASIALRTQPSQGSPLESVYRSIMARHFKIVAPLPSQPQLDYLLGRRRIAANMDRIALGLRGDITFADSFASTYEPMAFRARELAANQLSILADAEVAFAEGRGDTFFYPFAEVSIAEERQQVRSEFGGSMKQALLDARNSSGYVKHRIPGAHERTDPSLPVIDASQKGSIHINFRTVLGEPRFSDLNVALTIVHEASHKFVDTYDLGYTYELDKYNRLTQEQALRNADSYAFAALSFYLRRLLSTAADLYQAA